MGLTKTVVEKGHFPVGLELINVSRLPTAPTHQAQDAINPPPMTREGPTSQGCLHPSAQAG